MAKESVMEVKTKIDAKMQKEMLKKQLILSYVFIACGAVGALIGFFVLIFFDSGEYFACSAIVLGCGLGLLIASKKMIKSAEVSNKENIYTFGADFVEVKTMYHDDEMGTLKLYYTDILKIKETKNYIFIFPDNTKAYPVLKENVSDLEELKKLIHKNK